MKLAWTHYTPTRNLPAFSDSAHGYRIIHNPRAYRCIFNRRGHHLRDLGTFPTLSAAIAAAQTHHDNYVTALTS